MQKISLAVKRERVDRRASQGLPWSPSTPCPTVAREDKCIDFAKTDRPGDPFFFLFGSILGLADFFFVYVKERMMKHTHRTKPH